MIFLLSPDCNSNIQAELRKFGHFALLMEAMLGVTHSKKIFKQCSGNNYYKQQAMELDTYSRKLQAVAQMLKQEVAEQQLKARTLQELVLQQDAVRAAVEATQSQSAAAVRPGVVGNYNNSLLLSASPHLWHQVSQMTPEVCK